MAATVLIVDDDATVRTTLETLLRAVLEWRVFSVESGPEALVWLKDQSADLVITDLCMPGMSGTAFIRELRSLGINIPVVVVSGYLKTLESEEALRAQGVAAVLEKPFGMRELVEAVRPLVAA